MQALVRALVLLLVGGAATACHVSDPGTPDAPTTTDGSDTGGPGLTLKWETKAPIPGAVDTDLTVTSMLYRMHALSVIGDAGSLMQNTFQLAWSDANHPPALTFADAPTGLYSKIALLADGNLIDYSYEIYGTVVVSGETHQYKIHDRSPVGITLDTSLMLEPGGGATVNVRLDIEQALHDLDFSMLTNDAGVLELDTFDNQMGDFRTRMMSQVFDVSHVDG